MPLPHSFALKKEKILASLSRPADAYTDASPKGSLDAPIVDLIELINQYEGLVSTSSCSGRVSVWAEPVTGESGENGHGNENGGKDEDEQGHDSVDDGQDQGQDGERGEGELDLPKAERPSDTAVTATKQKRKKNFGKGSGGRWLFVSHEPIEDSQELYGALGFNEDDTSAQDIHLDRETKETVSTRNAAPRAKGLVHFKFEPMILHVLAASNLHAQRLLHAALQAGFRESGAVNVASTSFRNTHTSTNSGKDAEVCPVVAVRSTGLALDCIVGVCRFATDISKDTPSVSQNQTEEALTVETLISKTHLRLLIKSANDHFAKNAKRTRRFEDLMRESLFPKAAPTSRGVEWEQPEARRARLRAEGLIRREKVIKSRQTASQSGDTGLAANTQDSTAHGDLNLGIFDKG